MGISTKKVCEMIISTLKVGDFMYGWWWRFWGFKNVIFQNCRYLIPIKKLKGASVECLARINIDELLCFLNKNPEVWYIGIFWVYT